MLWVGPKDQEKSTNYVNYFFQSLSLSGLNSFVFLAEFSVSVSISSNLPGEDMYFKCTECENKFVFAEQLEKHMAAHERTKKYTKFLSTSSGDYKLEKCNQCEFSTPHAANLNKHIIKKTKG